MNRDQKAAAIAEIAAHIDESQAVFAVDYKGISVPQAAELRAALRNNDATFKVVKNSLTERAADQAGADQLKALLEGPTALTFVRGDVAGAAKAIADYGRANTPLPYKGGLMDGTPLDADQFRALSRLPSREVLYGQLVGVVASPVGGLVRSLSALVSGLAVALGQVREKKESGEIPAGEAPAAAEPEAAAEPQAEATPEAPESDAAPEAEATPEAPEADAAPEPEAEAPTQAEPEQTDAPAETQDDNQADASAQEQPTTDASDDGGSAPDDGDTADATPTKED